MGRDVIRAKVGKNDVGMSRCKSTRMRHFPPSPSSLGAREKGELSSLAYY